MKAVLKRVYLYIPLLIAALLQNVVHEGAHFAAARLFGEEILAFRLFTNGWGTSQVIFATPVEQRIGIQWLLIAWLPLLVTILIGYTIYVSRAKLLTKSSVVNIATWYLGVMFMVIDPLYFGVLSWFFERSDVNAVEIIGWPAWPFQLIGLLLLALGVIFTRRWCEESQTHLEDYQLKVFANQTNKI